MKRMLLIAGLLATISAFAADKTVSITIDDLPFVGTTNSHPKKLQREHDRFMRIMQALIDEKVPATGFVVAGSIEKDQWQLLESFHKNGFVIGNHTYDHISLGNNSAKRYISSIERADKKIAPLMTERPKYFRYPYLSEGRGARKEAVRDYLHSHGYVIAPVTIDSKDFKFSQQLFSVAYRARGRYLPGLTKRYLAYIWRQTLRAEKHLARIGEPNASQILLLHANLLNSFAMQDIIKMYKARGYRFVSLKQAMASYKKPSETQAALSLSHQRALANYYLGRKRGTKTDLPITEISGLHRSHYVPAHYSSLDVFHPRLHTR